MWFVVVGVLLVLMKWLEVGPVADWSWWVILVPFALAVAWWAFSDATGMSKQREMDKVERKRQERRRKAFDALGIKPSAASGHEKAAAYRAAREKQ
jgi:small Trp-rich protein